MTEESINVADCFKPETAEIKTDQHWRRRLDNIVIRVTDIVHKYETVIIAFKFHDCDEIKYGLYEGEFRQLYTLLEDYNDGKEERERSTEACGAGKSVS